LTLRTVEGPIASSDTAVIAEHDRARENVQGVPLDPLVPVALIELITVGRVSEQARTRAGFGTQGLVEATEAARAKLVPVGATELAQKSWAFGEGTGHCSHSIR